MSGRISNDAHKITEVTQRIVCIYRGNKILVRHTPDKLTWHFRAYGARKIADVSRSDYFRQNCFSLAHFYPRDFSSTARRRRFHLFFNLVSSTRSFHSALRQSSPPRAASWRKRNFIFIQIPFPPLSYLRNYV